MAPLTFGLIAIAFVVAWLSFRLERAAARRRDLAAAQAVLVAVRRGLVLGMPGLGEEYQGWGRLYFAKAVGGSAALQAGTSAQQLIERGGSYQAYRVPVGPIERLASPQGAGTLLSEETVLAANLALWQIGVFNQLVEKQTSFNVAHAVEIVDGQTPADRRRAISLAAGAINTALHLDGIGRAADEGGWYRRLTEAVAADVRRLNQMRDSPWWRHYAGAWHLLAGDLLALVACAAVIALGSDRLYDALHEDAHPTPSGTSGPAAPSTSSTSSSPSTQSGAPYRTTTVTRSVSVRGLWP